MKFCTRDRQPLKQKGWLTWIIGGCCNISTNIGQTLRGTIYSVLHWAKSFQGNWKKKRCDGLKALYLETFLTAGTGTSDGIVLQKLCPGCPRLLCPMLRSDLIAMGEESDRRAPCHRPEANHGGSFMLGTPARVSESQITSLRQLNSSSPC